MSYYREIKDDVLKEWSNFRENTLFCFSNDEEDKRHGLNLDDFAYKIIRNISDKNKK